MWPRDVNDVMHRKRAPRIWGIWGKSVSGVLASEERTKFDKYLYEETELERKDII